MQKLLLAVLIINCQTAFAVLPTGVKQLHTLCRHPLKLVAELKLRQQHATRARWGRGYLQQYGIYPDHQTVTATGRLKRTLDGVNEAEINMLKCDIAILNARLAMAKCKRRPDCCLRVATATPLAVTPTKPLLDQRD